MPWKETCAMNERLGFVIEVERGERTVSELCRVFGISRKTGYKCLERYREFGEAGLEERSRAPHHHPNAMSKETATEIVRVRRLYPDWGPDKVLDWLERRHRRHVPALAGCRSAQARSLVSQRNESAIARLWGALVQAVGQRSVECRLQGPVSDG